MKELLKEKYSNLLNKVATDEIINLNRLFFKEGFYAYEEALKEAEKYSLNVDYSKLLDNSIVEYFNNDIVIQNKLIEKLPVYIFIKLLQSKGVKVYNRSDRSIFVGKLDKYNSIVINGTIYNIKVYKAPLNRNDRFKTIYLNLQVRDRLESGTVMAALDILADQFIKDNKLTSRNE